MRIFVRSVDLPGLMREGGAILERFPSMLVEFNALLSSAAAVSAAAAAGGTPGTSTNHTAGGRGGVAAAAGQSSSSSSAAEGRSISNYHSLSDAAPRGTGSTAPSTKTLQHPQRAPTVTEWLDFDQAKSFLVYLEETHPSRVSEFVQLVQRYDSGASPESLASLATEFQRLFHDDSSCVIHFFCLFPEAASFLPAPASSSLPPPLPPPPPPSSPPSPRARVAGSDPGLQRGGEVGERMSRRAGEAASHLGGQKPPPKLCTSTCLDRIMRYASALTFRNSLSSYSSDGSGSRKYMCPLGPPGFFPKSLATERMRSWFLTPFL
eukprot:GHVU01131059.1.p1 GENE.GHVU01131059.1~~GHVU01131059.1.p1  ORF type:complete len:321 (+),score=39.90 GHVU01131059.1:863-1825(+)